MESIRSSGIYLGALGSAISAEIGVILIALDSCSSWHTADGVCCMLGSRPSSFLSELVGRIKISPPGVILSPVSAA